MASIQSQMTLDSGTGGILKSITAALDTTLGLFEQIQQAAGGAFDTAALSSARIQLAGVNAELQKMVNSSEKTEGQQKKNGNAVSKGISALKGMVDQINTVTKAYALAKTAVTGFLNAADAQISAQVRLGAAVGTGEDYGRIMSKAGEIQSGGMYSDQVMLAGAAALTGYTADSEAAASLMDTLSDYAAGMSGGGAVDAAGMAAYAAQLGKAMQGDYSGLGELTQAQKTVMEQGTEMEKALVLDEVVSQRWAGMYEIMSNTPAGQVARLGNALTGVRETVGAGIYPAVLGLVSAVQEHLPQIQTLALNFAAALGTALSIVSALTEGAIAFGSAAADNWSWIAPVVWGVVAALAAYNAVAGIGWLTTLKDVAAKVAHAAASVVEYAAIFALMVAQNGLNAAMAACPVTWIVIGIIALIAVIYAIIGAINKATDSSISATGLIMGAFATLLTFVFNTFLVPLMRVLSTLSNFIYNVFNDPIAAVRVAFYDLALTVLGYVLKIGHGIQDLVNMIPGVDIDITSNLDSVYAGVEEAQQKIKDESGWVEFVGYQDYLDYSEAASAGYGFGEWIADKFSFDLGSLDEYMADLNGLPDTESAELDEKLTGIADDTGSIADSLEVSGETLEYLRDIAERDAINRFTTAEIKIDMTGMTNRIDSSADLDGILNRLTDGFTGALLTAAEGVHC